MNPGHQRFAKTSCAVFLSLAVGAAVAASSTAGTEKSGSVKQTAKMPSSDTQQQIAAATNVVQKFESEPEIKAILDKAKGVFIVPTYARGGWGIGVRGGEGVMLVNKNGQWSSPVFYNYGGMSWGAQAGAEVGAIAMFLMNDKAVNEFREENNFALNAGAGLTIVNYTGKAQGAVGNGDVVVWSDTKGAFANATVGITDIHFDDGDNREFYGAGVSSKDILSGKVGATRAASLKQALSDQAVSNVGSSGSAGGSGSKGSSNSPDASNSSGTSGNSDKSAGTGSSTSK